MKKVLIISPHFPPVNAADMQRVRQSLPYFREFGWEPVVITVDEAYVEAYSIDPLLLRTFPQDTEVHKVKAFRPGLTRKVGLGSLSMRSYFQIQKKGDELLRSGTFDLVYFSTTAFHVMALGPRWKKKFGVPYILDIQDPWRNDFYAAQEANRKNMKLQAMHRLDTFLEAKTVPQADGIISVSPGYRDVYLERYKELTANQFSVIPFGCMTLDFAIARRHIKSSGKVQLQEGKFHMIYVGRGGHDLHRAIDILFDAVRQLEHNAPELFARLQLWFIGTSYAPEGRGSKTIEPIAKAKGLGDKVTEISDRIPYFETLYLLEKADMLLVPGSTDATYTASKIYPYLFVNKPLLALFNRNSTVCEVIRSTSKARVLAFDEELNDTARQELVQQAAEYITDVAEKRVQDGGINLNAFDRYTARSMTRRQVDFFETILQTTP